MELYEGSDGARPCVGPAIKVKREKQGWSARELSRRAGLSAAYVCKIEAGAVEPSLASFSKLAVALGLSAAEIYTIIANEGASAFLSHPPARVGVDV